jgi:hypothetical protein
MTGQSWHTLSPRLAASNRPSSRRVRWLFSMRITWRSCSTLVNCRRTGGLSRRPGAYSSRWVSPTKSTAHAFARPIRQGLSWHSCSSRKRTISPSSINREPAALMCRRRCGRTVRMEAAAAKLGRQAMVDERLTMKTVRLDPIAPAATVSAGVFCVKSLLRHR